MGLNCSELMFFTALHKSSTCYILEKILLTVGIPAYGHELGSHIILHEVVILLEKIIDMLVQYVKNTTVNQYYGLSIKTSNSIKCFVQMH